MSFIFMWQEKHKINTVTDQVRWNVYSSPATLWKVRGWNPNLYTYIYKLIFSIINIYVVDLYLLIQTYYYLTLSPTSFHKLLLFHLSNLSTYQIYTLYSSDCSSWKSWCQSLLLALSSFPVPSNKMKAPWLHTVSFHATESSVLSTHCMAITQVIIQRVCEWTKFVTNICLLSKCYQCQLNRQAHISFGFPYFLPISSFSIIQIALMHPAIANILKKQKNLISPYQEPTTCEIGQKPSKSPLYLVPTSCLGFQNPL